MKGVVIVAALLYNLTGMESKAIKHTTGKRKVSRTKSASQKPERRGAPRSLHLEKARQVLLSAESETKPQNNREAGQADVVDADTHHIAAMVGRHNGDASWGRIFANIKANRRKLAKPSKTIE